MNEPRATISRQFNSRQVVFRVAVRLLLLSAFAAASSHGFRSAFVALLGLSAIYCAILGAVRREAAFGPVLTYWDEAAGYAIVGLSMRLAVVQ